MRPSSPIIPFGETPAPEAGEFRVAEGAASLRRQATDMLRRAIVGGHFAPGEHLNERVLVDTLAVSRTSVREAIRQLEAEGLVETLQHRGSFVRVVRLEEIKQIFDVRAALEALAARNFALEGREEDLEALIEVFGRLKEQEHGGTVAAIIQLKQEYYQVLTAISSNSYVRKMLGQILNQITMFRTASAGYPGRFSKSLRELEPLHEAFRQRDGELAAQLSYEHVMNARRVVIEIAERSEKSSSLLY